MELVPEAYVVELEPVAYPRAPIGKKRIWYDARTLTPLTMISYDRQGKVWKQWEGGFDYYERKPGMKWIEGVPEHFWSWTHVHAHDLQNNRMSRFYYAQTVPGGYHATVRRRPTVRRLLFDRGPGASRPVVSGADWDVHRKERSLSRNAKAALSAGPVYAGSASFSCRSI
jgi:hypothetical protein